MLDAVESEEGTDLHPNWGQNDDENTAYIYELYTDGDALGSTAAPMPKALMGALGGVKGWRARVGHAHAGRRQGPAACPRPISTGILGHTGAWPDTRSSTPSSSAGSPDAGFGLRWPERIRSP